MMVMREIMVSSHLQVVSPDRNRIDFPLKSPTPASFPLARTTSDRQLTLLKHFPFLYLYCSRFISSDCESRAGPSPPHICVSTITTVSSFCYPSYFLSQLPHQTELGSLIPGWTVSIKQKENVSLDINSERCLVILLSPFLS